MKIIYKKGNLVDATEKVIAHGCNNKGVMNSGVAKAIRENYPEAYSYYMIGCRTNSLKLGNVIWAPCSGKNFKLIANCITQDGFGYDSKQYVDYDAVAECMKEINNGSKIYTEAWPDSESANFQSFALPKIGAGLGGGDWNIISDIIENECDFIQPVVYEL